MQKLFYVLALVLVVAACDNSETSSVQGKRNAVSVSDAYAFATPGSFPAAAVFMTLANKTKDNDTMIGFTTNRGTKAELHTMEMNGDIMQMRAVDGYEVEAGQQHVLQSGGDHIMVFGIKNPLKAGDSFEGRAVFEKAGEIPVTVMVRERSTSRSEMNMQNK